MQTLIVATREDFISMVRAAIREESSSTPETKSEIDPANLTKKEAATALRVSLSTINNLIRSRQLPVFNIGKLVFIKRSDIDLYIKSKA